MAGVFSFGQSFLRRSAPGLFAGLLILQLFGLVIAAGLGAAHPSSGRSDARTLAQPICNVDARDQGAPPVEGDGSVTCCSHCILSARAMGDGAILGFVAVFAAFFPPRPAARPILHTPDAPAPRRYGWSSSWSSRAPPRVSAAA